MDLNSYAVEHLADASAHKQFARRIGVSPGYLSHLIKGRRKPSDSVAINIERETSGLVTCEELCPDTDWQYIRNTQPKKSA